MDLCQEDGKKQCWWHSLGEDADVLKRMQWTLTHSHMNPNWKFMFMDAIAEIESLRKANIENRLDQIESKIDFISGALAPKALDTGDDDDYTKC